MEKRILIIELVLMLLFSSVVPISIGYYVEISDNNEHSSYRGILYVGGHGPNNYTNIQDAINDASKGDTVFVYDDSSPYHESIIINKSISLIGEDKNTTIIDGNINKNEDIRVTANKVKIKGFTLTRASRGLKISGANNTEIAYNIFKNLGYGIEYDFSNYGNGHNIHHNIFKNNFWGIVFCNLDYALIYNNLFDNYQLGLEIIFSDYNMIFNNSFFDGLNIEDSYHNNVYNNTFDGEPIIYFENEKDMVIEDAGLVLLVTCENITIKNCDFNNETRGIHLCACKDCKIINNTFTKERLGCYLDYDSNTIITGNLFNGCGEGLALWECVKTVLKYNNFTNCSLGIGFEWSCYFNQIIHNNFIKNKIDLIFFGLFCQVRNNYWGEPKLLPKIIQVGMPGYNDRILIDWFPAKEPYDI